MAEYISPLRVKVPYPDDWEQKREDKIAVKSPRSSSADNFREKIIIYPYISKRSLEREAKETLNWLRTGPNINEFRLLGKNIISVGDIENNAIEYTFTYTSNRHGLIKGKLCLAKIPTGFLEFEYR